MSASSSVFKSKLIGSWKLVSYTATAVNDASDIIHPLGEGCRGRAIYSHDGYISAHIQSNNVKPYSSGRYTANAEELADAAKKTLTYTGSFRLVSDDSDPEHKATVYYDVEASIPTTWVGTTEVRELEIEDGPDGESYLYLRPPGSVDINGVQRTVQVKTIRARDNSSRL